MKKIILSVLLLTSSLFACCCTPASCLPVIQSMQEASIDNINDVTSIDDKTGEIWVNKIQKTLDELNSLKEESLKKNKEISNLEMANLIESYKEEFNFLKLAEYKKQSFQIKEITNKSNLLEMNIDLQIRQLDSTNEIESLIKK